MAKRAALLFFLAFSSGAWADSLEINPQHPEQYTVAPRDTLWDISAKFLKSPWQWRTLWHGNPQIKNPNLIYAGDVLIFSMENGQPSLRLAGSSNGIKKLHPSIRRSPLDEEIKVIPADAINQFLNMPRVVGKNELESSPYVIEFPEEHLIASAGNKVYVRSILNPQTLNYSFYRKGEPYVQPQTGEILGYEGIYIASATLERDGDPALLVLTKSKQELRLGDRLLPDFDTAATLNFFPSPAPANMDGNIISIVDGVTQIGRYDIVVIDKGSTDGLKAGSVLKVYQRGKVIQDRYREPDNVTAVKLPDEIAGTLMVFRPFERVSYALVMDATQAIHLLDKVKSP